MVALADTIHPYPNSNSLFIDTSETESEMSRNFFMTMTAILSFVPVAFADDPLKVGMNAPTSIVAEFITGGWSERGVSCPVLGNRDAMKVAVFVKRFDDSVLPLIESIEKIVADDASLKWSFAFVSHENAPTPSQEEWNTQCAQIRKLTGERSIKRLSVGLLLRIPDDGKPTKAKRQLGIFHESNVVVMLIRPDANAKRGVISYLSHLKAEELNEQSIERVTDQLKAAIAAESKRVP